MCNNSDPFGLVSDTTQQKARPPQGKPDSAKQDPCEKYKSSPTIAALCRRVTGPAASPANKCTADCLAKQWEEAEKKAGRPLTPKEKLNYIVRDHPICYHRCGYEKTDFAQDFLLGARQGRKPPPNATACAKAGDDHCDGLGDP